MMPCLYDCTFVWVLWSTSKSHHFADVINALYTIFTKYFEKVIFNHSNFLIKELNVDIFNPNNLKLTPIKCIESEIFRCILSLYKIMWKVSDMVTVFPWLIQVEIPTFANSCKINSHCQRKYFPPPTFFNLSISRSRIHSTLEIYLIS